MLAPSASWHRTTPEPVGDGDGAADGNAVGVALGAGVGGAVGGGVGGAVGGGVGIIAHVWLQQGETVSNIRSSSFSILLFVVVEIYKFLL